ncbi:MAG: MBL fold metallo-hydrolase [Gemmatimonadota bacterium]|nr:MBL fold metallo-hydrolase [Gemmatimonadota bacterium]
MKLAVLGSGSRGNAVALRTQGHTLLVDAGFGPRALERRAEEAGVPLAPLAGIVLTHEHGDHARGAAALAARHDCPVFASAGTLHALAGGGPRSILLPPYGGALTIGPFTVSAARTAHDAREPVAVAITSLAGHKIGVAYDLGRPTAAVRHLLRDCSVLLLEANHDEVLLRTGPYPASVRQRIGGSTGHLSNRAAAALAAELCGPRLEAVVLLHLSEQCNTAVLARRAVVAALRERQFRGRVLVASQTTPLAALSLRGPSQLTLALPAAGPTPPAR